MHSDQRTPFTSWAFTDRAQQSGLVPSTISRGLLRLMEASPNVVRAALAVGVGVILGGVRSSRPGEDCAV